MDWEKYRMSLLSENDDEAIIASDWLAKNLNDEIFTFLAELLNSEDEFARDIAAVTLAKTNDNRAIEPLFEAIQKKENENNRGVLVGCLDAFDIDEKFVDIFKLYLFGNFKVSVFALDLLNTKSFDIRPRTLKKASKALHHFSHNIGEEDDKAQERKEEATIILKELEELLAEEN